MGKLFKNISIAIYRSLISNNPDPIFLLDPDGNVLDINAAATAIFGYTLEEFKQLHYTNIVVPEQVRDAKRLFIKGLRGEASSYQANALTKSGQVLHLQVKNVPMFDNQEFVGVMIEAKDVSDLHETKVALHEIENRYQSLLNDLPEPVYVLSKGIIRYINQTGSQILGYSEPRDLHGRDIMDFVHPDSKRKVADRIQATINESTLPKEKIEQKMLRADGSSFNVEGSSLGIEYEGEAATQVIFTDVSERKKMMKALITSEEKYRLIAENMTDLVAIIGENGVMKYASPSHLPILGYSSEEFEGTVAFDIVHPENLSEVHAKFKFLFETFESAVLEFRSKHKTKGWVWLETKASIFNDEEHGKKFMLIVSREIEERKELQEKLKQMAFHDELTGLPNRRLFQDRIQQTLKDAKRNPKKCALLFLDIDKFKWVNDHLGHSIGDELLKQFGKRIVSCLRESDTLARLGGDEFTILLPDIQKEENARLCAERIIERLQDPWTIGEHTFKTTSSIGIAFYPKDGLTMDHLLTNADRALYAAKESGRNMYQVYAE